MLVFYFLYFHVPRVFVFVCACVVSYLFVLGARSRAENSTHIQLEPHNTQREKKKEEHIEKEMGSMETFADVGNRSFIRSRKK